MTTRSLLVLALAVSMGVSLLPLGAFAQQGADLGAQGLQGYAVQPQGDLPTTIIRIINWTLVLVGVLALAFIVYAGFLYITSRGDEGQVERAKNIIVNAVIGIVIIGVAAVLVNFVIDALLNS